MNYFAYEASHPYKFIIKTSQTIDNYKEINIL